jgi:voltage-gated potassium channel Kch
MLITTAIHATCTGAVMRVLRLMHASEWAGRSALRGVSVISIVVLMMFLASLFEAGIWATVYVFQGALPDLERALYFSTVTFTTLGYGDITLDASWRLLSAFQAANGTIMFGWTTAIVMTVLHRLVADRRAADREAAAAQGGRSARVSPREPRIP